MLLYDNVYCLILLLNVINITLILHIIAHHYIYINRQIISNEGPQTKLILELSDV